MARDIELRVFTMSGKQNGRAFITVPFLKTEDELSFINAALDINGSGNYESGEWVIKNIPTIPEKNTKNSYHFTSGLPLEGQKKLRVILSDFPLTQDLWEGPTLPTGRQFVEAELALKTQDVKDFINLSIGKTFMWSSTTLDNLNSSLHAKTNVPLEIYLIDPATNEIVGGHTVTLHKIYSTRDKKFIEITDGVAADEGFHIYEIKDSNEILNYGLFDGLAVINIANE